MSRKDWDRDRAFLLGIRRGKWGQGMMPLSRQVGLTVHWSTPTLVDSLVSLSQLNLELTNKGLVSALVHIPWIWPYCELLGRSADRACWGPNSKGPTGPHRAEKVERSRTVWKAAPDDSEFKRSKSYTMSLGGEVEMPRSDQEIGIQDCKGFRGLPMAPTDVNISTRKVLLVVNAVGLYDDRHTYWAC